MEKKIQGFTLLKLIGAIQVMYIHLVHHFHLEQLPFGISVDVFRLLSPFEGVPVFFSLSAYFLWKSLSGRPQSPGQYARRRLLRIFPELWIITAFTAVSILVLEADALSPLPFLGWIGAQASFLQFWTPDCLRSFGVGCPNGSLWTITIFLQFYAALWFLHRLLHGRSLRVWCPVLVLSAVLNVAPEAVKSSMPDIVYKLYQQTLLPYLSLFLFAAMVAEFSVFFRKPIHGRAAALILYLILVLGLPFDLQGAGYPLLRSMLICLFAISFGHSIPCHFPSIDISYELYLVHMPVVNILLELTATQSWGTFALSAGITVLLALGLYRVNGIILKRLETAKAL